MKIPRRHALGAALLAAVVMIAWWLHGERLDPRPEASGLQANTPVAAPVAERGTAAPAAAVAADDAIDASTEYVARRLLVRLRAGVAADAVERLLATTGTTLARDFPNDATLKLLALPDGLTVPRARQLFAARPEVEIAEPDYIYRIAVVPDDPSFTEQWGLLNRGQLGGVAGVDIGATAAWNRTTGRDTVYIGVIDTGIYYNHPDLAPNVWTNPGETLGNDVDDDGNGWVDDVHGINADGDAYTSHDGDPEDNNGHGTGVAGIIAARGNDGVGVTGVMWRARLIGCKALNGNGGGRLSSFIQCLEYFSMLKSSGIDIVATNNSWGGGPYSQLLYNAIERHRQQGMLFVSAAGNGGRDLDVEPDYPAAYDLDNILSVAAIDRTGALAEFSNYGATTVDIAAPGAAILTPYLDTYDTLDGTSLAAPYVTGVVGLLKAKDASLTAAALKSRILATGVAVPGLQGRVLSGRRLLADIPVVDRDADGMDDDWELSLNLNPASPADATGDPDGDGLTNVGEYQASSDPRRGDTDSDGLADGVEVLTHETNPNVADTDGDTLTDFAEVATHGTNPTRADTDNDGLTDAQEVQTPGTQPLNADTDSDGVPDGWERRHGLNPSVADAAADRDGDGLTNAQEFALDSDPNAADTDGDGLGDFAEDRTHGTSPTLADTDGDAAADGWELANGFNPLAAADGALDTDSDGWSNHAESRVGTNPRAAASIPTIRPWSEVQGGPTHTGHVPFETDAADFSVRWVRGVDGGTAGAVTAIAGDRIVTGYETPETNQASIAARRLLDGAEEWRHELGTSSLVIAVTAAAGAAYSIVDVDGVSRLEAVDVTTGVGRFGRPVSRHWTSRFATSHAGRLYVLDGNAAYVAGVTSYDAQTGNELWHTELGPGSMAGRSIAVDDSHVVVAPGPSTLSILDRVTGDLVFAISEPSCLGEGGDTIVDGAGAAYAFANGCVVKFDLATRRVVWQRDGLSTLLDSVAVDDDQVYVGDSARVVALHADDGTDAWRWQGPDRLVGQRIGNLVVTLDHVFVSTDGGTFALDRATGTPEWSHGLTGKLAVSEDGALIITSYRMLGAIDLLGDRDGDALPDWWERRYGFDPVSAADGAGDADADGVANAAEFAARTEPRSTDTDADGLSDGEEVQRATDPHGADTDHDGLGDRDEVVVHGTLPTEVDSDDDGYTDYDERVTYLTNARDGASIPTTLLRSHRESFENGPPPDWSFAEPGSPASWALVDDVASEGAFSLFGQPAGLDTPIAEWRRSFEAGDLSFALRLDGVGRFRIYVDGVEGLVVESVDAPAWVRHAIHVPRGEHRIRLAAEGSGRVWLDDLRFEIPAPFASDARNTFLTSGTSLRELTRDGAWARAPLQLPGSTLLFDAVILPDHRIAIADPPRLHVFDPVSSYSYATTVEGWHAGNALVATDTHILAVNGLAEGGLLRFDIEGRYLGRIHVGRLYKDLTKAENGTLYALQRDNGVIDTIDAQTLAIVATTELELAAGASLSVVPSGEFYVTDLWCRRPCINVIVRYASDGRFIDYRDVGEALNTPIGFLRDVDYLPPGRLAISTLGGAVVFATPDFGEFSLVAGGYEPVLTDAWVARVEKRGVDSDGDALPDWWERLHRFNVASAADRLLDADGDGLTNLEEFARDTSPRSADTDVDGLTDGVEVNARGTDPLAVDGDRDGLGDGEEASLGTSPTMVDTDGDGLGDGSEVATHHTDPLRIDTDGDGGGDGWELGNGLDPLVASDASLDNDLDGVSNIAELAFGTDPNDFDTDYDGADDGYEVNVSSTDPLRDDSDGDRVPDGWEIDEGFDPRAAADATLDADGDGFDNRTEHYADSNPRNARSFPVVEAWYTHQGTAAHTGYVPVRLVPNLFTAYWLRKPVAGSTLNLRQPAAVDGRVFVTNGTYAHDSTVAELEGLTGAEAWRFSLGFAMNVGHSPPAFAAGRVFTFSSGNPGRLLGFDSSGNAFDRQESSTALNHLAPTPYGHDIYVAFNNIGGRLGAYDARTGMLRWYVDASLLEGWTPAVDRDFVYFWNPPIDATPAHLSVLYRSDGARRATILDPNFAFTYPNIGGSPVLGARMNALVINGGRLVSFDLRRSRVAWEKQADYAGTPSVANGVVYVLDGGVLVALEENDGRELWRWMPPTIIDSDIIATIDHVFVATRTTTYAIAVANGQSAWSYPRGGALAIGNDRVLYIAGTDGALQAVATFADADRDGVADAWEQLHALSPANASDATLDGDGDGITNRGEFHAQTDPRLADTDGDGLSDLAEVGHSDPLRADSDADGLQDAAEVDLYGSDPRNVDSDADGLSDSVEALTHQTDLVRADTDGDSIPDALEVGRGSDPRAASSKPQPVTHMVESFESGRVPAHWHNGAGAAAGWEVVAGGVDGDYELRSAPVDPLEVAAVEWTDYFGGGRVIFHASVAESPLNDPIELLIDGQLVTKLDTTSPYVVLEAPIEPGVHTLRWQFKYGTIGDGVYHPVGHIDFVQVTSAQRDDDGDGMSDDWERANGLNPLRARDATEDPDGDGLSNLGEHDARTDPQLRDTDRDGLPDGWEVRYGFDPTVGGDAPNDPDGDGYTNTQEHDAGTDPTSAASRPPPPTPPPPTPPPPVTPTPPSSGGGGGGGATEPLAILLLLACWLLNGTRRKRMPVQMSR